MNDAQIRSNFHRQRLQKYHDSSNTLVIDELGIKHGKNRADIAVISENLIGFEIKSDEDSLSRLSGQIKAYNDVFDKASIVVGERYSRQVKEKVPNWWGIVIAHEVNPGVVSFETIREEKDNPSTDNFSVAQLLWREEVKDILETFGLKGSILRQNRKYLYHLLIDTLESKELRKKVSEYLKNRKNWRCHTPAFQCDGLFQPYARQ